MTHALGDVVVQCLAEGGNEEGRHPVYLQTEGRRKRLHLYIHTEPTSSAGEDEGFELLCPVTPKSA